jgi:hypothetical protein
MVPSKETAATATIRPDLVRTRWARALLMATLAMGTFLLRSTSAAANGRFPLANQIVFSPTDPDLVVMRTTYGILPSHDHGATWRYICEDALGLVPNSLTDPPIALTGHDSLLAGTTIGLDVSPDVGCNWNCIGGGLASQTVVDLAVRPDSPSSAVAITSSFEETDSSQPLWLNQVFETRNDGVTWAPIGVPIDTSVIVTTIDVAKTDPNRLYVSGSRDFGQERTASLFVSKDKGQTWVEWPLAASQFDFALEDSIFIGGVDPTNAERLYLRSSAQLTGGRSRLTAVTLAANGTPAFSTVYVFDVDSSDFTYVTGQMLGFALSPDGSKVYIGDRGGLWVARASDLAFHKNSSTPIGCLATHGNELWACSATGIAESGFVAGMSSDDGKTFTSKLAQVGALAGPVACSPSGGTAGCGTNANASQCRASYEVLCSAYGCEANTPLALDQDASVDAGGDASTNGSAPPAKTTPARSSCTLGARGEGRGVIELGAAFALVGLAIERRKRRSRRAPRP